MIGRTAHEAVVRLGPGGEGVAAVDQLGVAGGELPGAADAIAGGRRGEGHLVEMGGGALEIVEVGGGGDGVLECGMRGDIPHPPAEDVDFAAVAQGFEMTGCGFHEVSL